MKATWVFVLQALNHSRRNVDNSRQRPRRMSSHEMAMTIPVLSSGIPCCDAYETASALPSRASRSFSEKGRSWMPLCNTPLLRPLASSPTPSFFSSTMIREGLDWRRCASSLAMAQPTTPAPTMPTSYDFIWSNSPTFLIGQANCVLDANLHTWPTQDNLTGVTRRIRSFSNPGQEAFHV